MSVYWHSFKLPSVSTMSPLCPPPHDHAYTSYAKVQSVVKCIIKLWHIKDTTKRHRVIRNEAFRNVGFRARRWVECYM